MNRQVLYNCGLLLA